MLFVLCAAKVVNFTISFFLFFYSFLIIVRHSQWNGGLFDSQMYRMFNNLLARSHFYLNFSNFKNCSNSIMCWFSSVIELNTDGTNHILFAIFFSVQWHPSYSFFRFLLLWFRRNNYTELKKNALLFLPSYFCFFSPLSLSFDVVFLVLRWCLNVYF